MFHIIAGVLILAAAGSLAVIYRDTHRFVTRNYTLELPGLKRDCRIAVLADLHSQSYGKGNEKLRKAIGEAAPDLVLIAGDMIVSEPGASMETAIELVTALSARYPVCFGIGNHEARIFRDRKTYGSMGKRLRKRLAGRAFILDNRQMVFPEFGLKIYGLDLDMLYYKKFRKQELEQETLQRLLGKPDPAYGTLLLAHNPEYFASYAEWGADLVLAGHLHGGILRLPWLGGVISTSFHLFPTYDGGLYEKNGSRMIVSRGLGTHTVPVRMFNPGELVIVDLKPGKRPA